MIDFKVKDLKAKDFILKGSMLLTYHLTFILYPNRIQQVQVEPKLGSNYEDFEPQLDLADDFLGDTVLSKLPQSCSNSTIANGFTVFSSGLTLDGVYQDGEEKSDYEEEKSDYGEISECED
ncbi:MAG: hypothetical protein EZS28_009258 [Streblomastix strix]|uniref:Uncharacterized protein n=1 Tax=Streblomastix strix TaxID=222440 RepID=A0A5J4WLG1_9EUKA|nr:MAG: hypothetical protein EZS28_009255 [Streblomastix strix]KAA6395218.1 MAG: hypothetical protein EZS28_009258 [Streblomastix strix]